MMVEQEVYVKSLLPGGDALAYEQGEGSKHYLVRQAVPGDLLLLSVVHKQRGVWRGGFSEIKQASEHRIMAACDVAAECGGCALQCLQLGQHARVKSQWVYDAFASAISRTTHWQPIERFDSYKDEQRRRRVRWHVARDQHGQVILGFYAFQSHDVVASTHCMVLTQALDAMRQALQQGLADSDVLPDTIYAVQLDDGMHVVLEYTKQAQTDFLSTVLWDGMPVQYWQRDKRGLSSCHKPALRLHDKLPSAVGDINICIGPEDFVQGQLSGNRMMIEQLLTWSDGAHHVVDLFAGAGNLSLPLASLGIQVLGAEVNMASVRAANSNAKRLKLSATYEQADLFGRFDVSSFVGADLLIVDPPRKGAQGICKQMNRLLPCKVAMVHCDVLSASRDAKLMQEQGYRLGALRALDLFPYSGHVESMSLWER